jgi:predicted amidohydrolase YtcJ
VSGTPAASRRVIVGHIRTMDPDAPVAAAMALDGDRIQAVGELGEVLAAAPSDVPIEHLVGATILPGLTDAHLHMQRGGLKVIHDMGDADHDLADVIATLDRTGFDPVWGDEPPTLDDRVRAIELIQPLLHRLGFTGIIDPATTDAEMAGYQRARRRGVLTMRVVAMPYPDVGDDADGVERAIQRLAGVGASTGFGDDLLRIGGIKVYFDGEGMKGEALLHEPWPHSGSTGHQRMDDAQFERLVDFCARNGWSVGVHAVGGAAVDSVIAAFARADIHSPLSGRQWQIIHGYLETSAGSMAEAARMGVVASVQPSISLRNGVRLVESLGARAENLNPLRSWIDAGTGVALGSDGPFFPFDPRELIWSAVTRRVRGSDVPLGAHEAITMDEALRGYTVDSAAAAFAEGRRGMLKAGSLADWTAFDVDPVVEGPDAFLTATTIRTVVGGRTVYDGAESSR